MNFQFLGYDATPTQKGYLGVVKVLAWDKIVLRFKLCERKDGKGTFIACAGSCNVPDDCGQDSYQQAFALDRTSDKEECESVIRKALKNVFNTAPSVFENQVANFGSNSGSVACSPSQQNPNYPSQAQQSLRGQAAPLMPPVAEFDFNVGNAPIPF